MPRVSAEADRTASRRREGRPGVGTMSAEGVGEPLRDTDGPVDRAPLRVRIWWWRGLGVLWLVDGLLQLQPHMALSNLDLILMGGWGEPGWLIGFLSDGFVHTVYANQWAVPLDGLLAGVQIFLGLSLLLNVDNAMGRWTLRLSVPFGLMVWVVAEWLGSLLSLSVSFVTGGPGAALLYVGMALLLLNDDIWRRPDGLLQIRRGVGLAWIIGALLQAFPTFWTANGLTTPFQQSLVMTPTSVRTWPISHFIAWASVHPQIANAVLVVGCLLFGLAIWKAWRGFVVYAAEGAWLLGIWWMGENFGALWGGMATDPNSAPVWALFMLPVWFS